MSGLWQQIYLGLFLFGSGFLLVQLFLGQLGGDMDADMDADFDLDADFDVDVDFDVDAEFDGDVGGEGHGRVGHDPTSTISFLTPLVIAPTLAAMGAIGLALSWALALPLLIHLPVAAIGGYAIGYALYLLLSRVVLPMQGSSEVRVADLWGTVAEVTIPIPVDGVGEIRYIAKGAYVTSPARTVGGEPVPRGRTVMIESIESSAARVRPTND